MGRHMAFCSACDRNVPVILRHGSWEEREPSYVDAAEAVICLDYGVHCTGSMCPLFLVPDEVESPLPDGPAPADRRRH